MKTKTTRVTTDRAPTIAELRTIADRIWDADHHARRVDSNTIVMTDEIRLGLASEIARIDGGDVAEMRNEHPEWLAGIAIGAWGREARQLARSPVAPVVPADPGEAEAASRRDMIDRSRDPNGAKVRRVAAALAERVVAILDGKDPGASRSDSTDALVIALAERLRNR